MLFMVHATVNLGYFVRKTAMHLAWVVLLIVLYSGYYCTEVGTNVTKRPEVVDIGSIFTFDSVIGRVAKLALEAAVEDVNSSPDILRGTTLKLTMHDSNSSGFLGILEGKYAVFIINTT